ncbi:Protein of unknown function [Bacillus cereus]|nr:Protein of unknown function [Bacillus cereus]
MKLLLTFIVLFVLITLLVDAWIMTGKILDSNLV